MAMQVLNRAQAFSPGSQLWVLHDDVNDPIVAKLDWYLNFQITRARNHQPKDLAPNLRAVLTENAITINEVKIDNSQPLLIRAGAQLPAEFVLIVPSKDLKKWPAIIHEKWQQMQKPTVRVFLPEKLTIDNFRGEWSDSDLAEMSVV